MLTSNKHELRLKLGQQLVRYDAGIPHVLLATVIGLF